MMAIQHVQQVKNWDCGLASAQMVLKTILGHRFSSDEFSEKCRELAFETNVWTIDVACLLQKFGVEHLYCTVTLGVDETYAEKRFYREDFNSEEARVNQLFRDADKTGLKIEKRSVTIDEIDKHLRENKVAIVLVDSITLNSGESQTSCCFRFFHSEKRNRHSNKDEEYAGHYIVVCGYNKSKRTIAYHDPALEQGPTHTSLEVFEQARKCHGTDEDIVFVKINST
ncbi:protein GUCD1-like [Oscarella lobularis]|uniref:protein GUCD1-like n=1 Tax=Oscarella lobularis TaxID=121494 RepID=UPI0033139578